MNQSDLIGFQNDFVAAVVDPSVEWDAALGIAQQDNWRFNIYRNNYFHGLIEQLAEAYPTVQSILGDDAFSVIAHRYLQYFPPKNVSLALFGEEFTHYLREISITKNDDLICDSALLDRAYLEALHAPDQVVIDPVVLSDLGDDLVGARFTPHGSLRIIESNISLVDTWKAYRKGIKVTNVTAQGALVTRPKSLVQVRGLSRAATQFGLGLMNNDTVADAYDKASDIDESFDITQVFSDFLLAGAFCDIKVPND